MPHRADLTGLRAILASLLLTGGVLVADLSLPSGIAAEVLYLTPVLLSLWSSRCGHTLAVTLLCSACVVLGFAVGGAPGLGPELGNRLLALLVLWVTAALLLQQHQVTAKLHAAEAQFRDLVAGSVQGILIHADDKALFVNQAYADMLGYTREEILRLPSLLALVAPHERPRLLQYHKARQRGEAAPVHYEFQALRKDGSPVWLENRVRLVRWEGRPAVQSTAVDISARKQAETALAQRMQQLEAVRAVSLEITRELEPTTVLQLIVQRVVELVAPASSGFISFWDEDSQTLVPRAWHGLGRWIGKVRFRLGEGLTGTVAQRRRGLLVNDYARSPYAIPELVPRVGHTAVLAEPLLYRQRLLGVITLGNEATGQPFTEQDRELLSLFAAQAAIALENARLFAALQESEARYRAFIAHSSEGVWRIEHEAPVPIDLPEAEQIERFYRHAYLAECNDAMARMYGYQRAEELVGKRLGELLVRSDPHNLAMLQAFIRSGYRLVAAESHELDAHGQVRIFVNSIVGIVEDGKLLRTWGTQRDITEQKRLEAQLRQAQKMQAIGTLAGGIAHDFNNLLAAMLGYTELALAELPPSSAAQAHLQEVLTAAYRARDLVQQILAFSRQRPPERRPVQLHQVVQEVLSLLRASLPATITLRTQLDTEADTVLADATQLHQVLMNLCANAEYAMRERGGLLEIAACPVELAASDTARPPELSPGPYVRLTVRDTGVGMPPHVQERIFDPFFTTKGVGEGTGMGLAVVHGIVAAHGGAIRVDSAPGQGTTFTIYLPRLLAALPEEASPQEASSPQAGCLLFVDDEPALVQWGQKVLTRLGFEVVACTGGQEALEAFSAAPQRFDLVITDQTMPQLTGDRLVQALRRLRHDIPVILCTGFSHRLDAEAARELGIDAFLYKPLTAQELADAVRYVLAARRSAAGQSSS